MFVNAMVSLFVYEQKNRTPALLPILKKRKQHIRSFLSTSHTGYIVGIPRYDK